MVTWTRLALDSKIDIEIARLAQDVETSLIINFKKNKELTPRELRTMSMRVLKAKSLLYVLIRQILIVIKDNLKDKTSDNIILHSFRANFARIVRRLDDLEDRLKLRGPHELKMEDIETFANEIREVLEGDIKIPIYTAIKLEPTDKRKFAYALYVIISHNVDIFGSQYRDEPKRKGSSWSSFSNYPTPSHNYLLSNKGQEAIKKGDLSDTKEVAEKLKETSLFDDIFEDDEENQDSDT